MSLVYDALKQQAGPAAPVRPAPPRASWWMRQAPGHRNALLLVAGAVVAAPLAFFAAAALDGRAAPVASAPSIAAASIVDGAHAASATAASMASAAQAQSAMPEALPAAPMDATSAQAASDDGIQTESVAAAAGVIASDGDGIATVVAQAEHAKAPAPTPVAAAPQPRAAAMELAPSSAPINITVAQRAPGPVQAATDQAAVEASVGRIEAAIAAGDVAAARQALATLETVLHADSLTLLRMRAWVAHGGEDMDAAEDLYRQIAGRVPDDLNAGVNIALLDARRGDVDDARNRLQRLAGRHARSPQVARALAELDALPR